MRHGVYLECNGFFHDFEFSTRGELLELMQKDQDLMNESLSNPVTLTQQSFSTFVEMENSSEERPAFSSYYYQQKAGGKTLQQWLDKNGVPE